jgi:hypothetical protein
MSIQKKSLISTLKTAKKAHVASAPEAGNAKGTKGVKLSRAVRITMGRKAAIRAAHFGRKARIS